MDSRFQTIQDLKSFLIIWFGQFVSLVGTSMTRFALIIWIFQQTGDALDLALLGFFAYGAYVIASPVAGIVVDRFDRKTVMLVSDTGAGVLTMGILVLYSVGQLQIWHLFLAQAITGALEAFQYPAYSAATTVLIPQKHYNRASGLQSFAQFGAEILAPFFAGLLLVIVDIQGVLIIDIVTFFVALLTLAVVNIPKPKFLEDDPAETKSRWRTLTFGARYVYARKGLLGILIIFAGINLFASLTYFSILPAMILSRSGGSEITLAIVQSALGFAGVVGGIILSVWGGPKRLIHPILAGAALSFLLGDFLFAVGQHVVVWVVAASLASLFIPFIDGAYRALWQMKVDPALQGRVFAFRNMVVMATRPVGFLLGGWLADNVFEPAMVPDGALVGVFGGIVGVGAGAGMGAMFLFTAILGMLMSLSGYLIPAIRNVQLELPDFQEHLGKES